MKLFYTIISQENQPQPDPVYSLGGFCSSSPALSSELNALFGNLSLMTIERNKPQYICLALKNTHTSEVTDAELWIENPPTNQAKFRIALAHPFNREFEATANIYARPFYGEFTEVDGVGDSVALPTLAPGALLGVWIERTINLQSEDVKLKNDCDYLFKNFKTEVETVERLNLKIKWTKE